MLSRAERAARLTLRPAPWAPSNGAASKEGWGRGKGDARQRSDANATAEAALGQTRRGSRAAYRLRAFQISSQGHRRAHSSGTFECRLVVSSGGRTSIRSSTSKPVPRSSRIQSP